METKDATSNGVSDVQDVVEVEDVILETESEVKAEPVALSGRELIMAKAADSRRAEIKEEIEEAGGTIDFGKPEAEDTLPEDVAGDKAPELPETVNHKVKVDGTELEISSDDINSKLGTEGEITPAKVIEYQKQATGDKRLEEAATQRRANEAKAQELAQREAELAVIRNTPAGESAIEIDPDLVEKLGTAILIEDQEGTAKALAQIISAARGPATVQQTITKEDLDNAALNAVATIDYNKDLEAGKATVRKDYAHLLDNGPLQASIDAEASRIFEADKSKKPSEILLEAAQSVQAKILKAAGSIQKSEMDLRLEQKRGASAHAAPRGAAVVASRGVDAAGEPTTRKQVAAQMVADRAIR